MKTANKFLLVLLGILFLNSASALLSDVTNITDSGGYKAVEYVANNTYLFNTSDWFHVNISNVTNKVLTINITFTYDNEPHHNKSFWFRCNSSGWMPIPSYTYTSGTKAEIGFIYNFSSCVDVSISRYLPYQYQRMVDYYDAQSQTYLEKEILWTSPQNKNMYLFTITNASISNDEKQTILIITRQHPLESSVSYLIEGMLNFLLNETDQKAQELREKYVWYIVPMANPDGVYYGRASDNYLYQNMNRYWSRETCVEVEVLKNLTRTINSSEGLDFYLDIHGGDFERGYLGGFNETYSANFADDYFTRQKIAYKSNRSIIFSDDFLVDNYNSINTSTVWIADNGNPFLSIVTETGNNNMSVNDSFYIDYNNAKEFTVLVTEMIYNPIICLKINENNESIIYDSTSSNNGTIIGATWNNDGVLIILTNAINYTLDTTSGALTLLTTSYLYSWIETSWNYDYNTTASSRDAAILRLTAILIAAGLIFLCYKWIKNNTEAFTKSDS